jgi:hypothetical protein
MIGLLLRLASWFLKPKEKYVRESLCLDSPLLFAKVNIKVNLSAQIRRRMSKE